MASRAEELASRSLLTILAGLPTGASIEGSEAIQNAWNGLEFFLPTVLRKVYPEWERESLDGFFPLFAHKTGERDNELFGFCILISDQTLTPIHLRLQLSPTGDKVSWLDLRLGESGPDGMVRLPYPTEGSIHKLLHTLSKRAATWQDAVRETGSLASLPESTGFDPPDKLDVFLDAVRWGAASTADVKNIQAPFRSGIDIEDDPPRR